MIAMDGGNARSAGARTCLFEPTGLALEHHPIGGKPGPKGNGSGFDNEQ